MTTLRVHLVRHEEAFEGSPDDLRALSPRGRRRMRQTASWLAEQSMRVDLILTSPLVRAVQTSELLADGLGFDGPIYARRLISEPHSLEAMLELFQELTPDVQSLAIVGHEPTLGMFTAFLLGIRSYPHAFRTGSMVALDLDFARMAASFAWRILPDGPTRLDDMNATG